MEAQQARQRIFEISFPKQVFTSFEAFVPHTVATPCISTTRFHPKGHLKKLHFSTNTVLCSSGTRTLSSADTRRDCSNGSRELRWHSDEKIVAFRAPAATGMHTGSGAQRTKTGPFELSRVYPRRKRAANITCWVHFTGRGLQALSFSGVGVGWSVGCSIFQEAAGGGGGSKPIRRYVPTHTPMPSRLAGVNTSTPNKRRVSTTFLVTSSKCVCGRGERQCLEQVNIVLKESNTKCTTFRHLALDCSEVFANFSPGKNTNSSFSFRWFSERMSVFYFNILPVFGFPRNQSQNVKKKKKFKLLREIKNRIGQRLLHTILNDVESFKHHYFFTNFLNL